MPAQLTSPAAGSSFAGGSQLFTWNAGAGVTSYKLTVGRTLGGQDIYAGPAGTALSAVVDGLADQWRVGVGAAAVEDRKRLAVRGL